jgi:hypothetical protein
LERQCIQEQLGNDFEYTGHGTPQFNGQVEREFAMLYGRVRTMPKDLREGVWTEAAKYATDVENVIVMTMKPITAIHYHQSEG